MSHKNLWDKRAYQQKYYALHREKLIAASKEYHAREMIENPERVRARVRAAKKRYAERHPERVLEQARRTMQRRREKDPVGYLNVARAWRAKNKERVAKYERAKEAKVQADPIKLAARYENRRQYRIKNAAKVRATKSLYKARRRIKSRTADSSCSAVQWMARCALYGWRCAYCWFDLNKMTVQMDHVVPLAKGGSNWPSNLVPACGKCNMRKNARVWIPKLPLLSVGG